MKRQDIFVSIIIGIVVALSAIVLVLETPEEKVVVSDDGVLRISGMWRADQPVTIEQKDGYYKVEPEWPAMAESLMLEAAIEDDEQALYRWNGAFSMWERLDQRVSVSRLGMFMVDKALDVDTPEFFSEYDALLTMAPENAVGFEIAVGVRVDDGDVIRLREAGQVGGCDGLMQRGNRKEQSVRETDARIFVNDVETLATLVFHADWVVNDTGCSETEGLKPMF